MRQIEYSHNSIENATATDHSVLFLDSCPNCGGVALNIVLTQNSVHYAAYRCRGCDWFRGWAEKPSTVKRREEIRAKIATLLDLSLTDWERKFLDGLKSQNKFSPKQIEALTRIATEKGAV